MMTNKIDEKNIRDLISVIRSSEEKLFKSLSKLVRKFYTEDNIVISDKYIYCKGEYNVTLIAHTDTVYDSSHISYTLKPDRSKMEIFIDREEWVMWSPNGLGADDRVGVFLILKILKSGLRPNILFTREEEVGGFGATAFTSDVLSASNGGKFPEPLKTVENDTKYFLQLDRRGFTDSVFYLCENNEFHNYINNFGFQTKLGSFSDISIICPNLRIAGVNVSVGYVGEHSYTERLYLLQVSKIYDIIKLMIYKSKNSVYYTYIAPLNIMSQEVLWEELEGSKSISLYDGTCGFCHMEKRDMINLDNGVGICNSCLEEAISKG